MGDARPGQSGKADNADAAHHLRGNPRRQQQYEEAQQTDRDAEAARLLIIEREQGQGALQQGEGDGGGERRPAQRGDRRPAVLQQRARAPDHHAEQHIVIKLDDDGGDGGENHIGNEACENQRQRIHPACARDQQHQRDGGDRPGKGDPKTAEQPRRREKERDQHQRQLRAASDGEGAVRGERVMHDLLQGATGEREQATGEKGGDDFR